MHFAVLLLLHLPTLSDFLKICRYRSGICKDIPNTLHNIFLDLKGWLHLRKSPQHSLVIPLSVLTHVLNMINSSPKIHYQLVGTNHHRGIYCTSHFAIVSQSTDLPCLPPEVPAIYNLWQKWKLIIGVWSFCLDKAGGHNCDF